MFPHNSKLICSLRSSMLIKMRERPIKTRRSFKASRAIIMKCRQETEGGGGGGGGG